MVRRLASFGNIVALRHDRKNTISFAPTRQAEAYWTSLRDGGDVPLRTRIDPRGISNILPYAFMIERISPSVASIRLAGQHLRTAIGSEPRGLPFGLFFAPESRSSVATTLNAVLDTPSIAELELLRTKGLAKGAVAARMILLPLRNPAGTIDRALGVFVPDESSRSWQGQYSLHDLKLRPVFGPARTPVDRLASLAASRDKTKPQTRPHLRLIKS